MRTVTDVRFPTMAQDEPPVDRDEQDDDASGEDTTGATIDQETLATLEGQQLDGDLPESDVPQSDEEAAPAGERTVNFAASGTVEFIGGDTDVELSIELDEDDSASVEGDAPQKPATVTVAEGGTIDFDSSEISALVTSQWTDNVEGEAEDPHCTIKQKGTVDDVRQTKSGSLIVKSRQVRSTEESGGPITSPADSPDYELLDVIGEGGMGVVYAARQSSIARTVAIKMLKDQDAGTVEQRDKFISEAVITGELDHPNIVPIYDLGANDSGALFYSMKRVKGTPWDKEIKKKSLDENLHILLRVADAVAFAHVNGVIHRDLKPENVMLGDFGEVLVMDWGLARISPEFPNADSVSQSNTMGGTPAYMAPEMATGPIDTVTIASDVYLLGAILYEIVTGRPPHSGKTVMACLFSAAKNKIAATKKSGELVDIALRAMATDPAERYASVKQFQDAVRLFQAHSESILLTESAAKRLTEAKKTHDYDLYARSLYGFEEALALWKRNRRAGELLQRARLAYAGAALDKGDYDLGVSLLDPAESSQRELHDKLQAAIGERDQRQRRLKLLKGLVAALVASVIAIVSVAYVAVSRQRDRAVVAEGEAQANFLQAEEQRQAAELARQEEERQKIRAIDAEQDAIDNFDQAEEARRQEVIAKNEAERNFKAAETAREAAVEARQAEQYAAYIARIGVANARIAENAFDRAKQLLEQCPPELRNWEWGRLNQLSQLSEQTWRLGSPVDAVAFAPDGAHFATGDWQGQASIWNLETGDRVKSFDHGQYVHAVAYDPAGERLASGSSDGTIRLYGAGDGELLRSLSGHTDAVLSVHFSADGRRLLSSGYDNTARLWDVESGEVLQVFRRHSWWVWAADFSPDGRRIVTAGQDGKAVVWERTPSSAQRPNSDSSGAEVPLYRWKTEFTQHRGPVYAAQFSPDGRRVATGGYDGRVLLWNPDDVRPTDIGRRLDNLPDPKTEFLELTGHGGPVRTLAFASGGASLASGGQDNVVILWNPATGEEINRLRGHASDVRSCSYSPDGALLLSAGADQQIKLWRPEETTEVRRVAKASATEGEAILDARFSPDGERIVAAGRDRAAAMWDAATLQLIQRYQEGHDFLASSAVFFADGSRLATGAGDSTVRVWDVATGAEIYRLDEVGRMAALDVSPDGRLVATGSRNHSVLLWNAVTGDQLAELAGHGADVTALRFGPDGRTLISGDERGRARVWTRGAPDERWTGGVWLEGHSRVINAIAFTQDGRRAVTASGDNTCGQWDVATGRELTDLVLKHPAWVSDLAVSADGQTALTSCDDGTVRLWSLQDAQLLQTIEPSGASAAITSIDLSPSGELAAAVSASEGVVRLWDLAARKELTFADSGGAARSWMELGGQGSIVWAARFAPDGRRLLTIGGNDARLIDLDSRDVAVRFSPHGAVASADLSPDGRLLATGSWDRSAKIWDAASGRVLVKLDEGHHGFINSVAFSPDGATVLTASDDGTARPWNPRTGDPLPIVLAGHQGRVYQARYSGDGSRILTASHDKTARIWDAASGQPLATLEGHEWAVRCGAFGPQGDRVITGGEDNVAIVWDAAVGQPLATLAGHTGAVTAAALSPDGARAVTGSEDGLVKIWDADQGQELLTLPGHRDTVTAVQFSPDGRTLLTSGRDGQVLLWTATPWGPEPSSAPR